MDTQVSPAQESTTNLDNVAARSKLSPEAELTPPTTAQASSSSRPRRPWPRLQDARNRLKALSLFDSHPPPSQPQDDGLSSQQGSSSKAHDASTLNEAIGHTEPTEEPPTCTANIRTSPASEHNKDKSEPDPNNPPLASSGQGHGNTIPPAMPVGKAAQDVNKLLDLDYGDVVWTLIYRLIHLEHLQGFRPEDYDQVQNTSVEVGRKLNYLYYIKKLSAAKGAVAEEVSDDSLSKPSQATTGQMPKSAEIRTLKEMQAARAEMPKTKAAGRLKKLRASVAQIPELAEGTKLPEALNLKAVKLSDQLNILRKEVPRQLRPGTATPPPTPARIWEGVHVVQEFKAAEAAITKKLKMTRDAAANTAAEKHDGPTYP
ncbi:hypothetical protein ACHAPT_002434 [Fusarium lateritium]